MPNQTPREHDYQPTKPMLLSKKNENLSVNLSQRLSPAKIHSNPRSVPDVSVQEDASQILLISDDIAIDLSSDSAVAVAKLLQKASDSVSQFISRKIRAGVKPAAFIVAVTELLNNVVAVVAHDFCVCGSSPPAPSLNATSIGRICFDHKNDSYSLLYDSSVVSSEKLNLLDCNLSGSSCNVTYHGVEMEFFNMVDKSFELVAQLTSQCKETFACHRELTDCLYSVINHAITPNHKEESNYNTAIIAALAVLGVIVLCIGAAVSYYIYTNRNYNRHDPEAQPIVDVAQPDVENIAVVRTNDHDNPEDQPYVPAAAHPNNAVGAIGYGTMVQRVANSPVFSSPSANVPSQPAGFNINNDGSEETSPARSNNSNRR